MIEISHQQARRWIAAALDGRALHEEQWLALQSHLEGCAECRAFRESLGQVEHDLHRSLRDRWLAVSGPRREMAEQVAQRSAAARRRRQYWQGGLMRLLGGWKAAAAIVLIGLAGWWLLAGGGAEDDLPAAPGGATAAAPAPSPTPLPEKLPGGVKFVLAYETVADGSPEIFLFNPGADPVNLTGHPAADTSPAWSPDGEWIAFLSDRSGKPEVFVMHVSGSRLTQITSAPDIYWHGPLSWSADGRWLALAGERVLPGQALNGREPVRARQAFLVPLDGGPVRALGYSTGAEGPRFAPSGPLLAYHSADYGHGILVYNPDSATFLDVTLDESRKTLLRAGEGGAFDWTGDGTRIVYRSRGPYRGDTLAISASENLRVTGVITMEALGSTFDGRNNLLVTKPRPSGFYQGVTASRDASLAAYLVSKGGCRQLAVVGVYETELEPVVLEGLCALGSAGRAAEWTAFDGWMIVRAYPEGAPQADTALYALGWQGSGGPLPGSELKAYRLAGAVGEGAVAVRPARDARSINPKPAQPRAEVQPLSAEEAALPEGMGRLLFVEQGQPAQPGEVPASAIVSLTPDGERADLLRESSRMSCPVWSPQGDRVAFVSNRMSEREDNDELFVMGGGKLERVSITAFDLQVATGAPFEGPVRHGCPVWSPDGARLAAAVAGNYLVIARTDGTQQKLIGFQQPLNVLLVRWTPDGQKLVVGLAAYGDTISGALVEVDPWVVSDLNRQGEYVGLESPGVRVLASGGGWYNFSALDFSPDFLRGSRLAAFLRVDMSAGGVALRVVDMTTAAELEDQVLGGSIAHYEDPGSLHYLPDGRKALVLRHPTNEAVKTRVMTEPVGARGWQVLAELEEITSASAWSRDGRWLALATETGIYLLDVEAAEAGSFPALHRVSGDQVTDLGWW